MRHDLTIRGEAFGLRPAELTDVDFIVALRTDPDRSRFIRTTSPDRADQERWMQTYFQRPHDFYWIIEHLGTGRPEGTIGIYGVDEDLHTAEWGRWILRHGSVAAVESALLIYRMAFGPLGLDDLVCRTLADNAQVVSFHESCGLRTERRLPRFVELDGVMHDAIEQRMTHTLWASCEPALATKAAALARIARR